MGAMAVGLATGEAGQAAMKTFSGDLFKGMLAFFLLDMGLLTARRLHTLSGMRRLHTLSGMPRLLLVWGLLAPLAHAGSALGLAAATHMSAGNAALLMALAASASYIAVAQWAVGT